MGIIETLIASQRRPEHEALRISAALKSAIPQEIQGHDAAAAAAVAAWGSAAEAVVERVNAEIADEKMPRRAPALSEHLEQFTDSDVEPGDGFDDAPDVQSDTHRVDPRYLLVEDDDHETSPRFPGHGGTDPGAGARPLHDPPRNADSVQEAQESVIVAGEPAACLREHSHEDGDFPGIADGDVTQPADDPDPDDAEPEGFNHESSGSGEDRAADEDAESDQPAPPARWERARSASPWGDADEIEPEFDTGDDSPDEDDEESACPAPSDQATAPPDGYDEPDPQPGESVAVRLGRALSTSGVARRFGGPHQKLKLYGVAAAALLLTFLVVVSFTLSGRGEPPQPAGQVADAPPQSDAPPPEAPKDLILVPATVSASCGNDSDAVAPFSNDRTRAWRCQRLNGLDLNVLNMTFSCPVVITSITVVPGFAYVAPDGRDEWVRNRVASAVSFRMGGAIYEMKMPNPTRTGVTQQFPNVITEVMSMTITASIRPTVQSKGTDTFGSKADEASKVDEFSAISKIVIKGHPVDPGSGLCGSVGG